ncbi:DNA-processing protein DprA [Empedobacter falsenii]
MLSNNRKIGLIALSNLKGIGPAFIKKYINENTFDSNSIVDVIKKIVISKKEIDVEDISIEIENAQNTLEKAIDYNVTILDYFDNDYPYKLKELKDAPPIIYCKGNLNLLKNNVICIIGTRKPNETGKIIAKRISEYFTQQEWSICNGVVDGIDDATIRDQNNYRKNIIGILGGGLDLENKTVNKIALENSKLLLQNGGLLISECPFGIKENTFSVVKSCRLQAGISDGLVLVQSSIDGGSKYTITSFAELSRIIGVIKPIKNDIELISYAANQLLITEKVDGLSRMTKLKLDKIKINNIIEIASKNDYLVFKNSILNDNNIEFTLF